jgi:sulfur-carrier protein adenylyltransferase/sulfurtransferase
MFTSITPEALKIKLQQGEAIQIVDVREPDELKIASVGAIHIPLGDLPHRYQELNAELPVAVLCHHGMRSARGAQFLVSVGFKDVRNISGGIDRWSQTTDPKIPRY